jgi:hypothetical protein
MPLSSQDCGEFWKTYKGESHFPGNLNAALCFLGKLRLPSLHAHGCLSLSSWLTFVTGGSTVCVPVSSTQGSCNRTKLGLSEWMPWGTVGVSTSGYLKWIITGFGFVLDDLGEGSRKQNFALSCLEVGNSMIGYCNKSYLEEDKNKLTLKLQLMKK